MLSITSLTVGQVCFYQTNTSSLLLPMISLSIHKENAESAVVMKELADD